MTTPSQSQLFVSLNRRWFGIHRREWVANQKRKCGRGKWRKSKGWRRGTQTWASHGIHWKVLLPHNLANFTHLSCKKSSWDSSSGVLRVDLLHVRVHSHSLQCILCLHRTEPFPSGLNTDGMGLWQPRINKCNHRYEKRIARTWNDICDELSDDLLVPMYSNRRYRPNGEA